MVSVAESQMKQVEVLLATYNGSQYVVPLMNSLLNQDYKNIKIIVRDDGSNDNTLEVLNRYTSYENVSIIEGEHEGVPESFFSLLQLSSSDSHYFAFSDQDDVWQRDKISRAIGFLGRLPQELPSMYCSRVLIVDEMLNPIDYSPIPKRAPSFENAIVENIATGCTIVINKAARDLLLNNSPKNALMHDWWTYLVVSAFGEVFYDPEPRILYRQHSSNVVGCKIGFINRWSSRVERFLKYSSLRRPTRQAMEFDEIYGASLPKDKKLVLDRFIDGRNTHMGRVLYALNGEIYRQSIIDSIILRVLILLNRI
jgi:glycosyltransferase involved in cell wall biosynthesis